MNNWLGNISLRHKLAIGFGLVLAITLGVALIGWSSLGSMIQRSNTMGTISALGQASSALQVARLDYMITDNDEQAADQVQAKLEALAAEQQQAQSVLLDETQRKVAVEVGEVIATYQTALDHMRSTYRDTMKARRDMTSHANLAVDQVNALRAAVRQGDPNDPQYQSEFMALTEFNDKLLMARYEVRGYIIVASPEREASLSKQVDLTLQGFQLLHGQLPRFKSELALLKTALDEYRASLEQFKTGNHQVESIRQTMDQQSDQLQALTTQLLKAQIEQRDQDAQQARSLQIGSALLALFLGIGAAILITRQITRPLQQTLAAVQRIAAGNLSQTLSVHRRDELGELQRGIQSMGDTLRELIGGIRDSVTQIASAAEELSAVTAQTSAGANTQKEETDQVATAMHEMSATVQEVARNAEQASIAAVAADHEATEGDQVVAEVILQIERLAEEVDRSTDAMELLKQESNKIGSVMDVIKSVAQQTNLLALNAAIEAARAGEAGRGFAVVADEVRALAQRTQRSTEEIEGLVAGLHHGTQQVASILHNSRGLTHSSVILTRQAGAALTSITDTVSNIQAMNQQIAAAAEQQSVVADEISRSVLNVRDVSEQTAAASEETAAASTELARLGNHLQVLVSRFQL